MDDITRIENKRQDSDLSRDWHSQVSPGEREIQWPQSHASVPLLSYEPRLYLETTLPTSAALITAALGEDFERFEAAVRRRG